MRLWPRFSVSSARPVWLQVVRGVAFFVFGAIVVLGGWMGVAAAKSAWDRQQDQRRSRVELASEGIFEACGRTVDRQCAQRGADKTKAEVAYLDDEYATLWVSISTLDYKAFQDGMLGDVWTQPRFAPDRSTRFRIDRTVVIDGVTVTLWDEFLAPSCGCSHTAFSTVPQRTETTVPPKPLIARATWSHDGHLYELGMFFGNDPIATLTKTFRAIRYATPSP